MMRKEGPPKKRIIKQYRSKNDNKEVLRGLRNPKFIFWGSQFLATWFKDGPLVCLWFGLFQVHSHCGFFIDILIFDCHVVFTINGFLNIHTMLISVTTVVEFHR